MKIRRKCPTVAVYKKIGGKGTYEVYLNNQLLYSKLKVKLNEFSNRRKDFLKKEHLDKE